MAATNDGSLGGGSNMVAFRDGSLGAAQSGSYKGGSLGGCGCSANGLGSTALAFGSPGATLAMLAVPVGLAIVIGLAMTGKKI